MALDEPKENDDVHQVDGFTFIIEKELEERAQPIKVDYTGFGFKIDCELQFGPSACSACGTGGDCH